MKKKVSINIDPELCQRNLQRLVDSGTELNTLVWIDMENASYVDRTLELFRRRMRMRSPLVGLALQAFTCTGQNATSSRCCRSAPLFGWSRGPISNRETRRFPENQTSTRTITAWRFVLNESEL